MKIKTLPILLAIMSINQCFSQSALSPFTSCPSDAFQVITLAPVNSNHTVLYGVNMTTGLFTSINSSVNLGAATGVTLLNATGYSSRDNLFYGFDVKTKKFFRMDKTGATEALTPDIAPQGSTVGTAANLNTVVSGDVNIAGNQLYVSHPTAKYIDVYDIPLPSSTSTTITHSHTLTLQDASLNPLYLRCSDFAFNPIDGKLYGYTQDISAVVPGTPTGQNLVQITVDLAGNTATVVPYLNNPVNVSTSGAGACYFDVNGNLYTGFNDGATNSSGAASGIVYKFPAISTVATGTVPPSIPFTYQPTTPNNDGARCLNAPENKLDFGDAPDTYKTDILKSATTTFNDPPRHDITTWLSSGGTTGLVLGTAVTAETDGNANATATGDTDDGIATAIAFTQGLSTTVPITVSGDATSLSNGKLSIWVDLNGDGVFDATEELITDHSVVSGTNNISISMPSTATAQTTSYMRIRLSTTASLSFIGPAPDGEVEDYTVSISANNPIKLIDINANLVNKTALINWTTANEYNSQGFDVERSTDGINFTKIATINSHNILNKTQYYSYIDNLILNSNVYYRLKLIDQNGYFEYSSIVKVKQNTKESYKIILKENDLTILNPTNSIINDINIFSADGKKLQSIKVNKIEQSNYALNFPLNLGNQKGIIMIQLQTANENIILKSFR